MDISLNGSKSAITAGIHTENKINMNFTDAVGLTSPDLSAGNPSTLPRLKANLDAPQQSNRSDK
jgi:hypothetical protein